MYNQAKLDILDVIRTMGEATSMDISKFTQRTPENSSMLLLRYHRQGLLHRRKVYGKARGYSLTERGLERLMWLESN